MTAPAQIAAALEAGLCPFCGRGPFVVPATHVVKVHEILASDLRRMAGLRWNDSICDSDHSDFRRGVMEEYRADGKIVPYEGPRWWGPPRKSRDEWDHGSASTYTNHDCRCAACTAANAAFVAKQRARRASESANAPHGTPGGYVNWGCRCGQCREAHREAKRAYRATR